MALSGSEAIFVKAMILHGNKDRAVREAYPRLEEGFEQAAMRYLMQNPEITNHINAGILYVYRNMIADTAVPQPRPLTVDDKINLLRMVVNGQRETPTYIVTPKGLRVIFSYPSEAEVKEAKYMLRELQEAEKTAWLF